jgi:hypothetical protein
MKTGKTPDDFKTLAARKGLLKEGVKAGEIVAWLKNDFGLGHGHAMAIYATFKEGKSKKEPVEKSIAKHFTGARARWKPLFDSLIAHVSRWGDDIRVAPSASYLSILRGDRKMAIVQVSGVRMDIGIKLKGAPVTQQFKSAGSWNTMMTHRVQILDVKPIDNEVMNWLRSAYEQNIKSS